MPCKPKAPTSPTGAILQLKIRLLDISPMIWRRVPDRLSALLDGRRLLAIGRAFPADLAGSAGSFYG
jgi:hypothetical protein